MTKYRFAPIGRLSKINFDALDIDVNWVVTDIIANIDSFTSSFNDEEEIKSYLKEYLRLSNNLFIYYEKDGIPYTTRVITNKDESFVPYIKDALENGNPRYVSTETHMFKEDLRRLLQSAKNERYVAYLHDNEYISDYLYNKLLSYREAKGEEEKIIIEKIKKNISNYKTLRTLYIGTRAYENAFNLNKDRKGVQDDVIVTGEELYEVFQPLENEELFYKTNISQPKHFDDDQTNIARAYSEGGMDEVYSYVDDIRDVGLTENDLKRIEKDERKLR